MRFIAAPLLAPRAGGDAPQSRPGPGRTPCRGPRAGPTCRPPATATSGHPARPAPEPRSGPATQPAHARSPPCRSPARRHRKRGCSQTRAAWRTLTWPRHPIDQACRLLPPRRSALARRTSRWRSASRCRSATRSRASCPVQSPASISVLPPWLAGTVMGPTVGSGPHRDITQRWSTWWNVPEQVQAGGGRRTQGRGAVDPDAQPRIKECGLAPRHGA